MKRSIVLTLLLLTSALGIIGCSRTVTGGYENSPDGKYRLWVRTIGAYGHAFVDRTHKTVRIRVDENPNLKNGGREVILFSKEYHFTCADVSLNSSWDDKGNLTLVVYDFGPGVSSYDAAQTHIASNHIATLSLTFDKQAGTFREKE